MNRYFQYSPLITPQVSGLNTGFTHEKPGGVNCSPAVLKAELTPLLPQVLGMARPVWPTVRKGCQFKQSNQVRIMTGAVVSVCFACLLRIGPTVCSITQNFNYQLQLALTMEALSCALCLPCSNWVEALLRVYTYQKLIGIGSSGLADKDPSSSFQVHLIWRALKAEHLGVRVAVEIEGHLVVQHADGEAGPGVNQGGDAKAGCLIRGLRIRLCVEEHDVLLSSLHGRQLHSHIHDLLGRVGDGEDDARFGGGGLQVEQK